ncbi:MAG: GNAT family protein [Desulfobacteraceae bacterium]|jgi:RimJ/RimL family protein N-acetyltransferase
MVDDPIIENEKIKLRRVRPSDAETIYEAVTESIAELSPWMPWCTKDYSIKESKTWCEAREDAWNKGKEYDFVILDKSSEILLGICGLNNINAEVKFANLGYWVRTGRTCQGTATAAVPMLSKFGFNTLNLNRIEIVVAEGNLPSQRVAEKAGALREGLLRHRLVVHGRILDAFMFSLVPA